MDLMKELQLYGMRASFDEVIASGLKRQLAALAFFDTLDGIGIPVASAVLTAVHPGAFTVIDRQVFKALGARWKEPPPAAWYRGYLRLCRQQSQALGRSLRDFDRALWQWGAEHPRNDKS